MVKLLLSLGADIAQGDTAGDGCWIAIFSAANVRSAVIRGDMAQPITRRAYRSRMAAR